MKKILISCAVALLSMTAFSASAANDNNNGKEGCKTECVGKGSCDKNKDCKGKKGKKGKKGHKGGKDCGRHGQQCCKAKKGNPTFAGIELTAEQQQKIEAINAKRKAAVEKSRKELQKAIEKDREAYNAEVRKVLTAEQQLTYDKNVAEMKARKAEKAAYKEAKNDLREMKKGMKKGFKAGKKDVNRLEREAVKEIKR